VYTREQYQHDKGKAYRDKIYNERERGGLRGAGQNANTSPEREGKSRQGQKLDNKALQREASRAKISLETKRGKER